MKEKVKKEVLTDQKIGMDLLKLLRREEKAAIIVLIISSVMILLLAALFIAEAMAGRLVFKLEDRIDYIFYAVIFVGAAVCEGAVLYNVVGRRRMLKKAAFDVEEDTLIDATLDARVSKSPYMDRHLLQFSRCGEYYIPYGTNYEWSKDYYMSDRGVFNTAIVGDTFYVVTYRNDKKRRPVIAYNTKQFEYKREET